MRLPDNRIECCQTFGSGTVENRHCFCQEICENMMKLRRRYNRMTTKRERTKQLAEPRYWVRPYQAKCACLFQNPIEIINVDDKREWTRTQQLAYPTVRKLLLFKKRVRYLFDYDRILALNRLIRKSLFSLYSALHKVQPPKEPVPKPKWTDKEWKKHRRYLRKLAKPKKVRKPPKIKRERKSLQELRRYKKLAKPRVYLSDEKPEWVFTPAMKNYTASDRVKAIAKPRFFDESTLYQEFPIKVSPGAMHYKITDRIQQLAMPLPSKMREKDTKDDAFTVSPNALKFKTTQRYIELSQPKEFVDIHTRANPFAISPLALKAKPTPRLIELAKPRSQS